MPTAQVTLYPGSSWFEVFLFHERFAASLPNKAVPFGGRAAPKLPVVSTHGCERSISQEGRCFSIATLPPVFGYQRR